MFARTSKKAPATTELLWDPRRERCRQLQRSVRALVRQSCLFRPERHPALINVYIIAPYTREPGGSNHHHRGELDRKTWRTPYSPLALKNKIPVLLHYIKGVKIDQKNVTRYVTRHEMSKNLPFTSGKWNLVLFI